MSSFNDQITEEFRANDGKVGGNFEGAPMLLLSTTGAKSGETRTTPLVYSTDEGRIVIYASNAGQAKHPGWYHNVQADPTATIEIREDGAIAERRVRVEVLAGAERDRIWEGQKERMPGFADYERSTTRTIPVVALVPAD